MSRPAERPHGPEGLASLATRVVHEATAAGITVGTAESLTAGAVSARLADVPGASVVLTGGVVVYATRLKHDLLGVDRRLLAEHGPVHPEVAVQMAIGCRRVLGCDLAVATTGVAGPGPADGHPAGTVHVALAWADPDDSGGEPQTQPLTLHRLLNLEGDRALVRQGSVVSAIELLTQGIALIRTARRQIHGNTDLPRGVDPEARP